MKNVKVILCLLLIIGSIIGGAFYWQWYVLHHMKVIAQPKHPANVEKSTETFNQEVPATPAQESQPPKKENKVNILVLGTDNRGNEVSRADLIMFITANVDTRHAAVVSIPRDTRVAFSNVGLTKINHANAVGEARGGVHEGTLESVEAVSNLLGVPINFYLKIDFEGFEKAVDAVGGIDVYLPNPVNDDLRDIHLTSGQHHLSGDQALRLARARYGLPNGDFDRQSNQFYLILALARQILNVSNVPKLPEIVKVVYQELIDTNMSAVEMVAIGLIFKGITKDEIKYYQIPGKAISDQDPLVGAVVYYYEPDVNGVREVMEQALAYTR